MIVPSYLPLILSLAGQAAEAPDTLPARLEVMTKSLASYEIHPAGTRDARRRFLAEPLLRFTNPVGNSRDGAVFLWVDERDRPEVAVQVFLTRNGPWPLVHELSSLATHPLVAETPSGTVWNPARGGAEFRAVPALPGRRRPPRSVSSRCGP